MAEKNQKKTLKASGIHLSQALEEWTTISHTVKEEGKVAPDQKMMREIEGLLIELKSKLDELSTPSTVEPTPAPNEPSESL
ncbi:MAG: hypothetical protein RJB66_2614 [Pseudomonadota bacterium]